MPELKDYVCDYGSGGESIQKIGNESGLSFPAAHTNAQDMSALAEAVRKESGTRFCFLPFCHTVEAETFGADINLGDEHAGPRVGSCKYDRLEEVFDLPIMDFSKGRIREVLKACEILHRKGDNVALEICGPFTVLNALIDIVQIMKGLRKMPERMSDLFNYIGEQIICYMRQAKPAGVKLFCYGDPAGGLNILGPKIAEYVARNFTVPFLLKAVRVLNGDALIHLCPKTSYLIAGLGLAEWRDIDLSGPVSYGEACLEVCGKADIVGELCAQNSKKILSGGRIRAVGIDSGLN